MPWDIRGDRKPPKRAAMKAVRTRGAVRTASNPCLSTEKMEPRLDGADG